MINTGKICRDIIDVRRNHSFRGYSIELNVNHYALRELMKQARQEMFVDEAGFTFFGCRVNVIDDSSPETRIKLCVVVRGGA